MWLAKLVAIEGMRRAHTLKMFDRPMGKAAHLSKVMHESPRKQRPSGDLMTGDHESKKSKDYPLVIVMMN